MKHIAGWFRRNNTLMAQAKDLARQLQEAWDKISGLREANDLLTTDRDYLRDQLHRLARERDEERRLRLEAEDRLLDGCLDDGDDSMGYRFSCVLDHTTGGRMSKTNYTMAAMYAEIDSHIQDLIDADKREDAELAEAAEELRDTYNEEE